LLRLYLARQHFGDQTVYGRIVVPTHHGQLDIATPLRCPEGAGPIDGHPATPQAHHTHRLLHRASPPAPGLGVSPGWAAVGLVFFGRTAIRRGMTNSP